MHSIVRILTVDGVHGHAEFATPLVCGSVLNVRLDDKDDGILVYSDAVRVAFRRFRLELLDISNNLLLEVECCANGVL